MDNGFLEEREAVQSSQSFITSISCWELCGGATGSTGVVERANKVFLGSWVWTLYCVIQFLQSVQIFCNLVGTHISNDCSSSGNHQIYRGGEVHENYSTVIGTVHYFLCNGLNSICSNNSPLHFGFSTPQRLGDCNTWAFDSSSDLRNICGGFDPYFSIKILETFSQFCKVANTSPKIGG